LLASGEFVEQLAATFHECRHTPLEQRFDEHCLTAKVVVECRRRQPGFGVDRSQRNAFKAVAAKEVFCAVE
jgi:xanthine dehydrogenase molybdopterin-binding subunit B